MQVGMLYLCTGRYSVYWKHFYASAEANFLPGTDKKYFVLTDSSGLPHANKPNVEVVHQEKQEWPLSTLYFYTYYSGLADQLTGLDFLFSFNANTIVAEPITPEEILPVGEERLVAALHPLYFHQSVSTYPYQRNARSMAYVPRSEGKYYFQNAFSGGYTADYLSVCRQLAANIQADLDKDIIAAWHDESHWNRYLAGRKDIKVLSPAYLYPENANCSLKINAKIVLLDKAGFGGHAWLRGAESAGRKRFFPGSKVRDVLCRCKQFVQGKIPLKIVDMNGGLGNQMFQYAFFLSLKEKYPEDLALLDTSSYLNVFKRGSHEKFSLKSAFNPGGKNSNLWSFARFLRGLCFFIHVPELVYKPWVQSLPQRGAVYYCGFWQSEKYFAAIENKLRAVFTFKQPASAECLSVLAELRKQNSVSVHVRRSDYCEKPVYRDLDEEGYYDSAISYINRYVPNAKFFIFSDDTQWCKHRFTGDQFHIVDCNRGADAYLDMFLMTQCKHNIIANSTFGWWGAWLNQNAEKIVVTPAEWFSDHSIHHDMDDILPETWVRI